MRQSDSALRLMKSRSSAARERAKRHRFLSSAHTPSSAQPTKLVNIKDGLCASAIQSHTRQHYKSLTVREYLLELR
jgi:hypothetical protein